MRLSLTLAAALTAAAVALPVAAQNIEIFIPGRDNAQPDVPPGPVGRLAECMMNADPASCTGVMLDPDRPQLESGVAGPPEVQLETLIFDPNDGGAVSTSAAPPAAPPAYDAPAQPYQPVALPSVAITVEFDFDSDRIRADQFAKVGALVTALRDPGLAGTRFAVIGHTDASGAAAYNCDLSRRRAQSVVGALQANAVQLQLIPVGLGETALKNVLDPNAAENRRVSFVRLPDDASVVLQSAASVCGV